MSNFNHFSHLRQQVKSCLEREAKMSPEQRKQHQWQFITTVAGVPYIVGKGGANTMFYQIGTKGERSLCMPKDMLEIISSWAGAKFAMYAIGRKPNTYSQGPFPELDQAKECDADNGEYIVGITKDGKVKRLFQMKSGITGSKWVPFKGKKK